MTPKPFERFRPHPWHGLSIGPNPPRLVHAFIEITPFDGVKYEVDKPSGYLRVVENLLEQPRYLMMAVMVTFVVII